MMEGDKLDLKLSLKPNHATQCAARRKQASRSAIKKLVKRRRLYNRKSKMSKLRCYLNYKKSGKLERSLFYQNFPQDVIKKVGNDQMVKKTVVEVPFNGPHLLKDFLHMYQMDLTAGLQQPIGWIDDTGMCFFPEVSSASDEESYDPCKHEHGNVHESSFHEAYSSDDIKLNLGIKIDGLDESKLKKCREGSNALAKHVQIDAKSECGQYDVQIEDNGNKIDQGKIDEELNQELYLDTFTEPENGKLDLDTVKKMFVDGMGSFGTFDIVEIFKCSSSSQQDRLDVFKKQVEIMKKQRAKENLHYAWLASSKGDLSPTMKYGVGYCGSSGTSIYDTGYLAVMEKMQNVSEATSVTYQGPMGLLRSELSYDELVVYLISSLSSIPSDLIVKKISGEEFMNKLRVTVGDNLVNTTFDLLRINAVVTFMNDVVALLFSDDPEGNRNNN